MDATAIAYAATVAAVLLGLSSRATVQLASRLRRRVNHFIAPVAAGLAVWSAVAALWHLFEGGPIPLSVAASAFVWIGWAAQRHRLPLGGMLIAAAEQAGILVSTAATAVLHGAVRLY